MTRIGLLGGSFDPIHLAHVALAQSALLHLNLDEVQLLPAADPWQRAPLTASPQQRVEMIRAAIDGLPGLSINLSEIERGGPTYTADTIDALPSGASYTWIFGADQLANFCTWQRWQDIAHQVDLAVAVRPGVALQTPPALADWLRQVGRRLHELPFAPMPVSASEIRQRLAAGQSVRDMLPDGVARYIARHGLYSAKTGR